MSPAPRPLPPDSPALRRGRVEVEVAADYIKPGPCPIHEPDDPECRPNYGRPCLGRFRRRSFETGRFRSTTDAREWARERLLCADELGERTGLVAYLTLYGDRDGWQAHAAGTITVDEARS